jgi:hypothetical protein
MSDAITDAAVACGDGVVEVEWLAGQNRLLADRAGLPESRPKQPCA